MRPRWRRACQSEGDEDDDELSLRCVAPCPVPCVEPGVVVPGVVPGVVVPVVPAAPVPGVVAGGSSQFAGAESPSEEVALPVGASALLTLQSVEDIVGSLLEDDELSWAKPGIATAASEPATRNAAVTDKILIMKISLSGPPARDERVAAYDADEA